MDPDSTFYFHSDPDPAADPVSVLKLGQANKRQILNTPNSTQKDSLCILKLFNKLYL